jgi:ribosome-associated protein
MARSDWETTNAIVAVVFFAFSVFLLWDNLFHRRRQAVEAVLAAGNACDELNGQDTRILELEPADSSLSDFFVVTSATDRRQARVLADVVKRRLLNEYGLDVTLKGNSADWILLDYLDFTVHIFVGKMRGYYDVEGSRASATSFTVSEFEKVLSLMPRDS